MLTLYFLLLAEVILTVTSLTPGYLLMGSKVLIIIFWKGWCKEAAK